MKRDAMDELMSLDPAKRVDLGAVQPRAFDALREGVTMTSRTLPKARRPLWRRTTIAAGLTVALLGGGVAYAAFLDGRAGGAIDQLTCMPSFVDPDALDAAAREGVYGGPQISGDPVADCARFATETGKRAVSDAVAFRYHGYLLVAPRGQVPADAVLVARPTSDDAAVLALQRSLDDFVDGGHSRCMTGADASAFAQAELTRLGLSGWRVSATRPASWSSESPAPAGATSAPTAVAAPSPDPAACRFLVADLREKLIVVQAREAVEPPEQVDPVAVELRTGIAEKCLSLADAKTAATRAGAAAQGYHLTTITDESASCTTVDLVAGGSIEVYLTGPTTARP